MTKIDLKLKPNLRQKIEKIKKNTKLFNKIIQKQIDDGEIVNVDISMHQMDRMEECDGGEASSLVTGSASLDLTSMLKNKYLGGKRSSPQENLSKEE